VPKPGTYVGISEITVEGLKFLMKAGEKKNSAKRRRIVVKRSSRETGVSRV
jgi:hypothetical protein